MAFAIQVDIEGKDELSGTLKRANQAVKQATVGIDRSLKGVDRELEGMSRTARSSGARINQALAGVKRRAGELAPTFRKAGVALAAFSAGGILLIKSFVGATETQLHAEQVLAATIKNAGGSWESYREQILATTAALQKKTNFGDEQQLLVLAQLVPALGSVELALKALPAVMEVATINNQDLTSAVRTLTPVLAGVTSTITGTSLKFDEAATSAERIDAIMKALGGTAEANADPFRQLGNAMGDLKEVMGEALLPVLIPMTNALRSLAEAAQGMRGPWLRLAVVAFGAATAFAALAGPALLIVGFLPTMATGFGMIAHMVRVTTTAIWGMVAAVDGLKAALITTGIGALIIGGGLLAEHFLFNQGKQSTPNLTMSGASGQGRPTMVNNTVNINNPQVRSDQDIQAINESLALGLRRTNRGAF